MDPRARGQALTLQLFEWAHQKLGGITPYCYAISMNAHSQDENLLFKILKNFKALSFKKGPLLEIFSLNFNQIKVHEPHLKKIVGPFSYLSLDGKKEIILKSTGKRWPLLHIEQGPCAEEGYLSPREGHTHMLCTTEKSSLSHYLKTTQIFPSATAQIIHHAMQDCDWHFVLTSDI